MSVEFEPIRLGQRRRRFDPITIGIVAVAIGLGAAVFKPWSGTAGDAAVLAPVDAGATPRAAASAPAAPSALPDATIPRVIDAWSASYPSWDSVKGVVRQHDAWGVRAIVIEAGESTFAERWFRFPSGGTKTSTAFVDPSDEAIVALGVTFPRAQTPLDVRIWRETNEGLDWIDTEPVGPVPSGGAFLYRRPGLTPATPRPWARGEYRVDVLVEGTIRRFGISIPDRFANVPSGTVRPNLHDVRPFIDASEASLSDVPYGLFATADGDAVSLAAEEGDQLDEVAAWLDVDPGTRRAPRSFVAEAYLPRATQLGVMLEARVVVMSASIARLAPEPMPTVVPVFDHTPRDGVSSSSVLFEAPDDGAWTPGVYRISISWADFDGQHEESWHVELRPGPIRSPGQLLSAARAWARYAGDTGIVRGTAEPLEGGPRSATIRLERTPPLDGAGYPLRDRLPCDGFRVDGPAGTFGVAQPVDAPPADVTARAHFEYSRSGHLPILTASGNVPGLILVAADGGEAPASLAHRYRVGEDLNTWSALCVEVG